MKKLLFSLLISGFVLAGNAFAGNVDTYGIGSRATSMGGAFSANASDPFAVYYNPAGLTQIESMTAAAGFTVVDPNLKAKDYYVEKDGETFIGPVDFNDESDSLVVPHLGYAMPLTSNISFGIAAYVPFGLHLKWDKTADPYANPGSYNSYESWYLREVVTPSVAYKINDNLSLGFGVSIGRSESGTNLNSFSLYPITGAIEAELTDDVNYSWNAGVMYKPTETVTIGVTYRGRTEADFEGTLELKGLSDTEKASLNASLASQGIQTLSADQYKYDIELKDVDHPEQVQFGVKYSPNKKVNMEVDMVWTHWSIVRQQTVVIKDPTPAIKALLGGSEDILARSWEDTRQVKVGFEYFLDDMFTLRCGFFYDPSPIPDDTFDIVWADGDKKTYSLGLGVNLGNWTIDTSVQYTQTELDRQVGGESTNMNESYGEGARVHASAEGKIYGYGLTASYHF